MRPTRDRLVSRFWGLGSLYCLPLGQGSISLPRPAFLRGLRPVFSPCSQPKSTPLRAMKREECTLTLHPPPEKKGWRPLYGKQPRPQASFPSVFHLSLYLLTLFSFFAFVKGLYAVVESTMWSSHSLPEGCGELGWGPR